METYVQKWGNSLAVRIPKALAAEVGLEENSAVKLFLDQQRLVVEPRRPPKYDLESLVAKVTARNRHGEVDTGEAVGDESW